MSGMDIGIDRDDTDLEKVSACSGWDENIEFLRKTILGNHMRRNNFVPEPGMIVKVRVESLFERIIDLGEVKITSEEPILMADLKGSSVCYTIEGIVGSDTYNCLIYHYPKGDMPNIKIYGRAKNKIRMHFCVNSIKPSDPQAS